VLKQTGQKRRKFECDRSGEWPRFSVHFQGNTLGASQAYQLWCERVSGLGGTKRILMARLRGSDGTDLGYMDEALQAQYTATWESLPDETQDAIRLATDPSRP
jgi:hypothetical protein